MKTFLGLLTVLMLVAARCTAQPNYDPFGWTTIAGDVNSMYSFADGTNRDAAFYNPNGLAIDRGGNLYVADTLNDVIRIVVPSDTNWVTITLVGQPGIAGYADGDSSTALFNNPIGLAVDSSGNIFVADTQNNAIREVTLDGTVSTLAGNPFLTNSTGFQLGGYVDGPGNVALFNHPYGIAVDKNGNLYVADSDNFVIRKMQPTGVGGWTVSTLAGAGGLGNLNGTGTNASFTSPWGIAVDSAGYVYVADNRNSMIRKISPDGVVTTLAGGDQTAKIVAGIPFGNADGTGTNAEFNFPAGLTLDNDGNVYVADQGNSEIRKVTPSGVVTTLGGLAAFNFYGNPVGDWIDGPASTARFNQPAGVAVDPDGNLYVTEESNNDIRWGHPRQVQVVALEVTQVIQDWSNSIPLIQGKDTFLRAHLQLAATASGKSPTPVVVTGALLYGTGPGGPLPGSPLVPYNTGGSLTVQTLFASDVNIRGAFTNSLNFELPPTWTTGAVSLQLSWPGGLRPTNVVSSNITASVKFFPAPVPQITFIPFQTISGISTTHDVDPNLFDSMGLKVLSCFPVAKINATYQTTPYLLAYSATQPSDAQVENILKATLGLGAGSPNQIFHGVVPVPSGPKYRWTGDTPLVPSTVPQASPVISYSLMIGDEPYGLGRQTVSHELGHNLQLWHDVDRHRFGSTNTPSGLVLALGAASETGPTNYFYPLFEPFDGYPNGAPTLGPMTTGANSMVYGLDIYTLKTAPGMEPVLSPTNTPGLGLDPNCYFDLMSYCRSGVPMAEDAWPSKVTYASLLTNLTSRFGLSPAAIRAQSVDFGDYLLVRGVVDFSNGAASFLPCLASSGTGTPPSEGSGTNFMLEARDANGQVLQTVQFALAADKVESTDTDPNVDFLVSLTANPAIHSLQLSQEGVVLATLTATPHAPALTLTTPNGGENFVTGTVNVAWSGSDADGDALTYTVQYSPDNGATWQAFALDFTGSSLAINVSDLARTTKGLLRVTASDGFNMTTAQSASTFTVQPHPPMVRIISPADGSIFISDQQLVLEASVIDRQDGSLDGTNVVWSSDQHGVIGTGAVLNFNSRTLGEGAHLITATVVDSAGLTNSATVHLIEIQAVQPNLSLQFVPANPGISSAYLHLTWPSTYTSYVLQQSGSAATGWISLTNNPPAIIGSQNTVNLPPTHTNLFFRLMLQP